MKFRTYGGLIAYRVNKKEIKSLLKTPACVQCGKAIEDDGFVIPITGRVLCPKHFRIYEHSAMRWDYSEEEHEKEREMEAAFDYIIGKKVSG